MHDGIAQSGDEVVGVQELIKGVLQGDQHPSLVRHEIIRGRHGGTIEALAHGRRETRLRRFSAGGFVASLWAGTAGDRFGNRGDERCAGVLANWVRVCEPAVCSCPGDGFGWLLRAEDSQRADAHQRTVDLALLIRSPA